MILASLTAVLLALAGGDQADSLVKSAVESSLPALGSNGLSRAVDGDLATCFESDRPPLPGDDVTLTFSRPVRATRLLAITGKADGSGRLVQGVLEISEDGETFGRPVPFEGGVARFDGADKVRAIRIRATGAQDAGLALREVVVDTPTPIGEALIVPRIRVDTSEVPELDGWGREAKELCDRWYPIIARLLATDGYSPPNTVGLVFKKRMKGVAFASGTTITISGPYVKAHKDDFGMVVHELTHVIQQYPDADAGWLVEGIADHVRIVEFEPDAPRPPIDPDRASYRDAYKTTATFLEWVERAYDPKLVTRLNAALRAGKYEDSLFEKATGKSLDTLWGEFVATLRRGEPKDAE